MDKIKKILKSEFIDGMKPFDWAFISIGLILQIIAIYISYINNEGYLLATSVSGITGCISVVLCARAKLSQYLVGYIQLFTYLFAVAIPTGLGGEVVENIIYGITMVFGIVTWIKNYKHTDTSGDKVETKSLTSKGWLVSLITTVVAITGLTALFTKFPEVNVFLTGSNNPAPLMDSITTVVPLVGQMLMCLRFSDQWIFWFVEDVASLIMFAMLGNTIMVAQYIFWTANTIYGYVNWKKSEK